MPLSIGQLLVPSSEAAVLRGLLDTLKSVGFVTDSWQEGSIQLSILRGVAKTYAEGTTVIKRLVEDTITQPAGAWLDLIGRYRYGIDRLPAIRTERNSEWTSAASAPAHTITSGSIIATDEGVRYLTTGPNVALAPGTSEIIPVRAEFGGRAGNVPFDTPLAIGPPAYSGVTVAFVDEPLTVVGVDIETDERYWLRCQLRWAELTYSIGLRAYEFWALTAAPNTRRVRAINNYPVDNEITVALDPGEPADIALVENFINGRIPPNDVVTVEAAAIVTQPITLTPRAHILTSEAATIVAIEAAIQASLDSIPIGGIIVSGAVAGRLLRDTITEALLCNSNLGVRSVGLTIPAADIVLGATDIVQGVFNIDVEPAL